MKRRSSSYLLLISLLSITVSGIALGNTGSQWVVDNVKDVKAVTEQLNESGLLDEFSAANVEAQMKAHQQAAQSLADHTNSRLEVELQRHAGLTEEQARHFSPDASERPNSHYAVFISFSMSDVEIKEAIRTAASAGAEVYLKGLRKGDNSITDTMRHLQRITQGMDERAFTRFNPSAFEEFNVTQVPTILYHSEGKTFTARGVMNLRWLKGHAIDDLESKDLGAYGPTKPVVERSIVEVFQERLANYDFEGSKKRTVNTFWKRQQFSTLPRANKNEVWFIDPTVKVTADIVNPRGDVLARAGDIINPLNSTGLAGQQNFIIFDATDIKQLKWATAAASSTQLAGQLMLMTSQVDKENGWDHLEAVREHFKQEIYMLPKELIQRFKLTSLPVVITPDMDKKVFKIEQFYLED